MITERTHFTEEDRVEKEVSQSMDINLLATKSREELLDLAKAEFMRSTI